MFCYSGCAIVTVFWKWRICWRDFGRCCVPLNGFMQNKYGTNSNHSMYTCYFFPNSWWGFFQDKFSKIWKMKIFTSTLEWLRLTREIMQEASNFTITFDYIVSPFELDNPNEIFNFRFKFSNDYLESQMIKMQWINWNKTWDTLTYFPFETIFHSGKTV